MDQLVATIHVIGLINQLNGFLDSIQNEFFSLLNKMDVSKSWSVYIINESGILIFQINEMDVKNS